MGLFTRQETAEEADLEKEIWAQIRNKPAYYLAAFPMKKSSHRKLIVGPLADRVIVSAPPEQSDKNKEQKVGGIIIPENGQTGRVMDPYFIATVLAIGPECKRVKAGYQVIVARPDLFHVATPGVDAYMIREPMITAVVH